jgi:hypothetical protein
MTSDTASNLGDAAQVLKATGVRATGVRATGVRATDVGANTRAIIADLVGWDWGGTDSV